MDTDIQQIIAKWIKDPKIRLEMFGEDLDYSVKITLIEPVMNEKLLQNIPELIEHSKILWHKFSLSSDLIYNIQLEDYINLNNGSNELNIMGLYIDSD